jgi:glycosyltransferase involved in cell wall biosynthesis
LRLLFVGWAYHVHFRRWVEAQVRRGHTVFVLDVGQEDADLPGATIWKLRSRRSRFSLRVAETRACIAWFRPDVIHAHWVPTAYLPMTAKPARVPLVVTAWGSDVYLWDKEGDDRSQHILAVLRGADLITCDSADMANAIRALVGNRENVDVIQWGIDRNVFHPGIDTTALRERLGLRDGPIVFFPRQLDPIYNPDVAIRAVPLVLQQIPDAQFLLKSYITPPDRLASLEKLIRELKLDNVVRIIDLVPYQEMAAYYNLADVVVSIASSDGAPMSMLEAMACGTPVIMSDLPSIREWVVHGESGVLVRPTDEQEVARAIVEVLSRRDWTRSMSEAAAAKVGRDADHAKEMARMDVYYRRLARGERTLADGRSGEAGTARVGDAR